MPVKFFATEGTEPSHRVRGRHHYRSNRSPAIWSLDFLSQWQSSGRHDFLPGLRSGRRRKGPLGCIHRGRTPRFVWVTRHQYNLRHSCRPTSEGTRYWQWRAAGLRLPPGHKGQLRDRRRGLEHQARRSYRPTAQGWAFFIFGGFNTPELASAWSKCRSLLAGDLGCPLTDHMLNRLQASSYKCELKEWASCVGVGLIKCLGASPEAFQTRGRVARAPACCSLESRRPRRGNSSRRPAKPEPFDMHTV